MPDTLKTDYVGDILDAEENEYRVYDIVDDNGTVVAANVHLTDKTVYTQVGDKFGPTDVNTQNTFINGLKETFSQTLADLKATNIAQAVGVLVSDTYAQVIAKLGAIVNRGAVTKTLTGGETYTIPQGYHNGSGTVKAPTQSGTYKPTQRKNNNDMGASNTYRYVDTTSVPNSNSTTYSVTSNGTKDMGETNIYRYVNVAVSGYASWVGENVTSGTNSLSIGGLTNGRKYIITAVSNGQTNPTVTSGATVLAQSSTFTPYSGSQRLCTFYVQATATTININYAGRYTCFAILP